MGSIIELIPISVIGCIFSVKKILSKVKQIPKYFHFSLLYIIFILFKYDIFMGVPEFRFSNILLFSSASTSLFLFFGSLSFEKVKSKKVILIIKNITNYTGGIYYTHPLFLGYLIKISFFFYERNYLSALTIYIMCYFFCFFGNKLFKSSKMKYLFI